jgi:hypothetical protein
MKIIKIEIVEPEIDNKYKIYSVTFKPNKIESFFGYKEKTCKYKETEYEFIGGSGGNVYINQDGEKLSRYDIIGKSLDNFKRKF